MRTAALGLGFLLLGCSSGAHVAVGGDSAGGSGGTGSVAQSGSGGLADLQSPECRTAGPKPGASPIRRLTRAEYDNTTADLLGDTSLPPNSFPEEAVELGFTNNASVQTASDLLAEGYETQAISLAMKAIPTGMLSAVVGCDPQLVGADACAHSFIEGFGKKAYRRPLDAEESERLFQFYAKSSAAYGGFEAGVRMVMEAMLQSPHFLYRVEAAPPDGAIRRVTGFELATRLSYLMWGSMPDDLLFQAAAKGALDAPAGISEQAQRMLLDPKVNRSMGKFFSEWLQLDTLGRVSRDATMFPTFTTDIKRLMRTETERFTTDVVFSGSGDLKGLLLGSYTFMNKPLADFYGVTGPTGDAFERVELDPTKRLGLLAQGSLMAAHANANQTSPVARGFFVRESILCTPPPPPPATIKVTPPAFDPTLSTRERFALHRTQAVCAGCHQLMDPVGLGFENFDAVGRYRSDEAGKPIDATGELSQTDVDGPFNGAAELASKLATSSMTRACVVKQWFRFGNGRGESEADDACTLDTLTKAFAASNGNVRDLLLQLTQTDTFLYRTNENGAMK